MDRHWKAAGETAADFAGEWHPASPAWTFSVSTTCRALCSV
jgi:hypothetical protein